MSAPIKRGGSWVARWFDHEDKRRASTHKTEAAARKAIRDGETKADNIRVGIERAPAADISFRDFVTDRWMKTDPKARGNRDTTIAEKQAHLDRYLMPALGDVPLAKVRGEVIDRLFAALRSDQLADENTGRYARGPLSNKTVKNVRATLRRILQAAVEWEVLPAVPALPKVKVAETERDFYTKAEKEKLLASCKEPERRALLLFALDTGARAGEQRAIEWGDIDWHNRKVLIRRAMPSHSMKVGPTKSGHSRDVPLTHTLAAALKAIQHLRGNLIFCRMDGSPLKIDHMHDRLETAARRAGLRRIAWHSLRHTWASHLAMANTPMRKLQKLGGWSSLALVERYSHLAPGDDDQITDALELTQSSGGDALVTQPLALSATA